MFFSPELGHYALALACIIATAQGIFPFIGLYYRNSLLINLTYRLAYGQCIALSVSFLCLIYAAVTNDFSVENIAMNSAVSKPLLYKITGVWGNHEGSILLWAFILSLCGTVVSLFGRHSLPTSLKARVIAILGLIAAGFELFCLTTSNPFMRIFPAPWDGQGMNPLLQDPGLAFHPPILYAGYVGFAVPFAFAIAALLEGHVDAAWGQWVRPWAITAWCFLTCGIAAGSWWSYYVLGWGGYWFWDPVENASLIPWLTGTALIHSAIVVEKRNTLKIWTILLSIGTFSFSLSGTFLVRSGILNSVHAFANDPARGIFILGLLGIVIGGSLLLFAYRAPLLTETNSTLFEPLSREGMLLLNNILLCSLCAVVLTGTLYPPFMAILTGQTISVGKPFFDATTIPLAIPLFVAMGIGPMLPWKRAHLWPLLNKLWFVIALTAIAALIASHKFYGLLPLVCATIAIWIIIASLSDIAQRVALLRAPFLTSINRACALPRSVIGVAIAHIGVGITVLGISAMSQAQHLIVEMPIGTTKHLAGYDWTLTGIAKKPGPNYMALVATLEVRNNGKLIATLHPARRHFNTQNQTIAHVSIASLPFADLYSVLGKQRTIDHTTTYVLKLHYNPLASWIWGGALIMVIGSAFSFSDRRNNHFRHILHRQHLSSSVIEAL
ncbi:MAG: heme lyase CcmF/NrfE family subunit [Acetobacter sp.]|nr:heme lyase CcmF/NrfE family subunit [Acetobacter sp.]